MRIYLKTKNILFFLIFLSLFFLQSGFIYILYYQTSLLFIITSFLFSSLIMCFSLSLILLHVGLKSERLNDKQKIYLRSLALILMLVSFNCLTIILF